MTVWVRVGRMEVRGRANLLERRRGCSRASVDGPASYLVVIIIDQNCHLGWLEFSLSVSLELRSGRGKAVEVIERAEGVLVEYKKRGGDGDGEEFGKVGNTDVIITKYRHGAAYSKVCDIFPFLFFLNISAFWLLF
jgi:hypothetical protein